VLEVTETDIVHVTDVNTINKLLEEHTIPRQFLLLEVVSILYVLVEFIVAVRENVTDVKVALHMLMVTT
tara:strand:- start:133 stop:339 length:207 start_codon:yes stop_codon:yes gene_type:complete